MTESIKVAVRVRPILPHESTSTCITVSGNQLRVGEDRFFAFDQVFDQQATADDVYVTMGQPLADTFLDGYNASTIAYGQTGAGKTFTMSALSSDVIQEVFCRLAEGEGHAEVPPLLSVSALEIYNEILVDLFVSKGPPSAGLPNSPSDSVGAFPDGGSPPAAAASTTLQLREDPKGGVYVSNLTERSVTTEEELLDLVDYATSKRKTASTLMNAYSSRSHCIVTLTLQRRGITSKCSFVDLAGSERFKKSLGLGGSANANMSGSGSSGGAIHAGHPNETAGSPNGTMGINVAGRLREGISINSGILALGNVIVALCERKAHIPYRSSKLTRVLQPMFGGNSRTAMVACVSPVSASFEESLNTLKYADRVKSIKTQPQFVVSAISSAEEAARTVATLHEEIASLKAQLATALADTAPSSSSPSTALVVPSREPNGTSSHAETMLRVELEELRAELAAERNLTRRLKEDLFTAEYTTMVEVEKRKVLEERLADLDTSASTPEFSQGNTPIHKSRPRSRTLSASRDRKGRASTAVVDDTTHTTTRRGVAPADEDHGRLTIAHLEKQNAETARRVSSYTRDQEKAVEARDALHGELRAAEARLEQSELARQQKEEELTRLREEYRVRLQGAEQKVSEYERRVALAEREMKTRQADIDRMQSLQVKVEGLREVVQRHRNTAREQQRRASEASVAHSTEVQQLQRQLREAEEQRTKLEVQLQRREEEMVRVRSKALTGTAQVRGTNQTPALRTPPPALSTSTPPANGAAHRTHSASPGTRVPQRGRPTGPATAVPVNPRRASAVPHTRTSPPTTRPDAIQKEIDATVTRLEHLERELAELLAYRATIEETRTEAMSWERPMESLRRQLTQVDQQIAADPNNAELIDQHQLLQHKLAELQPFQRIVMESTQQCEEFTNRIESLVETRRFYTRQVRRLQNQRDAAVTGAVETPGTMSMSHRRSGSTSGNTSLMAPPSDVSASPPSVREIAHARVVKINPRRYSH